jgi:hypothetical protein
MIRSDASDVLPFKGSGRIAIVRAEYQTETSVLPGSFAAPAALKPPGRRLSDTAYYDGALEQAGSRTEGKESEVCFLSFIMSFLTNF